MKKVKELKANSVGQLIITGVSGVALTDEEKDFLENSNIGGVILFAHNYESPGQLAELVNSIQVLRDEYPLFISVDHEGGRVQRFKDPFTHFPAMNDLASLESPKNCYEVHRIMAEELGACGINLSYSPCCDILTNPDNKVVGDRSFGTDADAVSKYVTSAIRGLQTHSVIACAKHFPGHGGTTKDSHFDLPLVKTALADIEAKELQPFVKASKARVEMIMMAHLQVDAIDEEVPTSLSPKAYAYLRDKLKFDRLIITDDMEMKAVADRFGTEDAAVRAIKAGADILIYRSMEQARLAYNGLKEAIKKKDIRNPMILEKINRVYQCKDKYLREYNPVYIPSVSEFFNKSGSKVYLEELKNKIEELKESV